GKLANPSMLAEAESPLIVTEPLYWAFPPTTKRTSPAPSMTPKTLDPEGVSVPNQIPAAALAEAGGGGGLAPPLEELPPPQPESRARAVSRAVNFLIAMIDS